MNEEIDAVNVVVNKSLIEKITLLETKVQTLEAERCLAREQSMESTLCYLRLRGVVLVSFGQTPDELCEALAKEFSTDYARDLMRHLFFLDNAPLSLQQRLDFKKAFNNGNTRW